MSSRLARSRRRSWISRSPGFAVLVLLAAASAPGALGAQVPGFERAALLDLYARTGGITWARSAGWLGPAGTECSWQGVVCDASDRVVALELADNRVRGRIPAGLAGLPRLESLDLSRNQLAGPLPPELGSLRRLRLLLVGSNRLGGAIPPELGALTSLQILVANDNRLGGSLPPELGGLRALQILDLSENLLSGEIPETFAGLRNLEQLWLADNQLSGTIPELLGGLRALSIVDLSQNLLSGPIPAGLGALGGLEFLSLEENALEGTIPESLCSLGSLSVLLLSGNHLSGSVPPCLGQLSALTILGADQNFLTGDIPETLGDLSALEVLALRENALSGPIPAALGRLDRLAILALDGNQLSGPIPEELGDLESLSVLTLALNDLEGPIPESFSRLESLEYLLLWANRLEGTIPASLASLPRLAGLGLSSNRFTGLVPVDFVSAPALEGIDLYYNAVSVDDEDLFVFLEDHGSEDFLFTQTLPPDDVFVQPIAETSLLLTWTPVFYTWNPGGYVVTAALSPQGPFEIVAVVEDKTASYAVLENLDPAEVAFLVVQSYTLPHEGNPNLVVSDPTLAVPLELAAPTASGFVELERERVVAVEGESKRLVVRRLGGDAGEITVTVASSGGSATPGTDYVPVSEVLTFGDGDSAAREIELDVLGDSLDDEGETIVVSLTGSAPEQIGARSATEIVVLDRTLASTTAADLASTGSEPRIASDGAGRRVVVWSAADGDGLGVRAQAFDGAGEPLGSEIVVNESLTGDQASPDVALLPDGGFVVVWESAAAESGAETGIVGRTFDAGGNPSSPEQLLGAGVPLPPANGDPSSSAGPSGGAPTSSRPRVDVAPDGRIFVVWEGTPEVAAGALSVGETGILGRAFDPGGGNDTGVMKIAVAGAGESTPDVAIEPSGEAVVVWAQAAGSAGSGAGIVGRRFAPSGDPVGGEITISDEDAAAPTRPDVEVTGSGDVAVVWQDEPRVPVLDRTASPRAGEQPTGTEVFGRRLAVDGSNTAASTVFRVNELRDGSQSAPDLQVTADGDCLIGWQSDDGAAGATARVRLLPGCREFGGPEVSATTTGVVRTPSVAADAAGGATLVFATEDRLEGDGGIGVVALSAADLRRPCVASEQTLCLAASRFEVSATWRDASGAVQSANVDPITEDTGTFWFFDRDNVEVVIKVLDGCAVNDRHWVFASGLTDLEVELTVRDSAAGAVRTYRNEAGQPFAPILDTAAFDTCFADQSWRPRGESLAVAPATVRSEASGACTETSADLCLTGARFQANVEWSTGAGGGIGQAQSLTDDTGYFWFFDPGNVEVVVKVLDACSVNGRFWVFAGGLTDTAVTLRVTDTETGAERTYTTQLGDPFQPIQDVNAFAACP